MMTLDEAIRHAEESIDLFKDEAKGRDLSNPYERHIAFEYGKSIKRYEQIIEWLKELKQLRKLELCEDAISRSRLLGKLDDCYKEKVKIAPNNMAEGFVQVEKLIKQEPSVTPVACIATVKFNKEDMRELVDEKVKELKTMAGDRVTCKDCKYNVKNGKNTTMCDIGHRFYMRDHNTFYCADAERR